MTNNWREFEELIAKIERLLAPRGAIVKSPDRIRDLITGVLREVDASIRYQIGSVPILITIECRDRSSVQDDTWIEQIGTKRQKIGAAKTIAVSSSGFSRPAVESAKLYGIEIRTTKEVAEADILSWFAITEINNVLYRQVLIDMKVVLKGPSSKADCVFDRAVEELIKADQLHAPVFHRHSDGVVLNLQNIIGLTKQREPRFFFDVPEDGTKVRKRLLAEFPEKHLWIQMVDGPADVSQLSMTLELFVEKITAPVQNIVEYRDDTGPIAYVGDAEAIIDNK